VGRKIAESVSRSIAFLMAIQVTKVSEAFYVASLTRPQVVEPWSTKEPIRLHHLWTELQSRGVHQTDAGDAIDQADRDWLESRQRRS
jgi:hypothetical protein